MLRRRWQARRLGDDPNPGPDGLPIPPATLQLATTHVADTQFYVETGRAAAALLRERAEEAGYDLAEVRTVFDFGCGCGRVARWWAADERFEVHGSDVNLAAIEWCTAKLSSAEFRVNGLEPPLPYAGESFDLLYSISVFTHLPVALQMRWAAELARVLRPGGVALLTMHGDLFARKELIQRELDRYRDGEPVVLYERLPGDRCSAFHPPAYVREQLLAGWEILRHYPGDATTMAQDLWVVKKKTAPSPPERNPGRS